jgi:serine kinase of HPr protein (carbohydrate metabolism regulator)
VSPIHATAVACRIRGVWQAVLLTGPSGAGKSDLALRLIGEGWRLVADDYCEVWRSGGTVFAAAPVRIAGFIEARGVGIAPVPHRWIARVALVVACAQVEPERMPEAATVPVAGLNLPVIAVDIRPASATRSVALALAQTLARTSAANPAPTPATSLTAVPL